MTTAIDCDLCVIGAGAAGLSVAAGASQMGARTVLIERGSMGGDCLNVGCVPSKALLAAAHAAQSVRTADRYGVQTDPPRPDFAAVNDHVHRTIARIAPMDSVERFQALGVTVLQGHARFTDPRRVAVDMTASAMATGAADTPTVTARRFVIATGSQPAIPPIAGLAEAPYLTNETVFQLRDAPDHLIILGAGPIGCELAQAHRQLGCAVTLIDRDRLLPREDAELAAVVRDRLAADGVEMREHTGVDRIDQADGRVVVTVRSADGATTDSRSIAGSHLLVAAGRKPVVDGLDLDKAGIIHGAAGIAVDGRLRTSNRRVFAMSDVTGGPQFTHLASYHAGVVIKNALFRLPSKAAPSALPRVTYTAPELAQTGLTESEARAQGTAIRILRWAFHENDRAQTEAETNGLIKAVVTPRGRVLGAGIAGHGAGELISLWTMAIANKLKIGAIANLVVPYPTLSEVSKRAAGQFYVPTLFSERTRRIVRFLQRI